MESKSKAVFSAVHAGKEGVQIAIDDMMEEDIGKVLTIERASFFIPRSEKMVRLELNLEFSKSLLARIRKKGINDVIGYINYWVVGSEMHLNYIAVGKDWQRMGIASTLMAEMKNQAHRERIFCATLKVRRSNEVARRLYGKYGFKLIGVVPLYYDDTKEDALIMQADWGKKDMIGKAAHE